MKKGLSGKEKFLMGVGALTVASVAIAVVPGVVAALADTVKKATDHKDCNEDNQSSEEMK